MTRTICLVLGLTAAAGCAAKNLGNSIILDTSVAPADPPSCLIDASSSLFRTHGFRDINVAPLTAYGYFLYPRVLNNMLTADQQAVKYGNINNIYVSAHDVIVDGFQACYDFRDTDVPADPGANCDELPGVTKAFLAAAAAVTPAGGKNVYSIDLFPPSVTQANLGDFTVAPGSAKQVVVHVQASGRTKDGTDIVSNELMYPVTICNGCLTVTCGAKQILDFTNICIGGQDGVAGCVAAP